MLPDRIVLIGPSGSGKSAVAARLSQTTGYEIADTDAAVVKRVGMPIAEFFERFGERAFRAIESEELSYVCARPRTIVATGGGVVLSESNWAAMRPDSVIVGLRADPETLLRRVRAHAASDGREAERPLLAGDAHARLASMLTARASLYSRADVTIDTDDFSPDVVAGTVLSACDAFYERGTVPRLCLDAASGRSEIYVASGARHIVGELARRRWPSARRVWIISDTNVDAIWGRSIDDAFTSSEIEVARLIVSPGEQSKSFRDVATLCEELTNRGVTRRDLVVALGGGVVGDLVGFVASVSLRGLPFMQVPTSLLAMVDSSVGGKTGVNLPAGKNLAGAFYQPGVVVIDPEFLGSLSQAEYRSGMAEVIKHSVIQPSTPLGGTSLAKLLSSVPLDPMPDDVIEDVLALNVAIKKSVVQEDEREGGLRMILNFGHTAGHAIEADGYRHRHGEAVALGMMVAMHIGVLLGRIGHGRVSILERQLSRAGLPVRFDGDVAHVIERLSRDKKNVDGPLHWILPTEQGGVEIVAGVDNAVIEHAIRAVHQPSVEAVHGATVL